MIPGMVVMAPKDESELRDMLYTAVMHRDGPIALRYPRGNGMGVPLKSHFETLPIGKAETVRAGTHIALLAIGDMVYPSLSAANILERSGIKAEVVNLRFVKPLDTELLDEVAKRFKHVVTLENNSIIGGIGGAVAEYYAALGAQAPLVHIHGIPDRFVDHGSPAELARELGLDAEGIAEFAAKCLQPSLTQNS